MVAPVAVPGWAGDRAEVLGDIAAVTGAAVVVGLGNGVGARGLGGGGAPGGSEVADAVGSLGAARRVIVTRERTLIVGGGGDRAAIAERVISIRAEIEARDSPGEREHLMKRLAMLAGGSVIIEVGGATEGASERLAGQVRRGLSAARLAFDYGLSAGGGAALADAGRALDKLPRSVGGGRRGDEAAGARVVLDSLTVPMRQLGANAGVPAALIGKAVKSRRDGAGFDLAGQGPTAGRTVPMRPQVVDALPVVTAAVANATALAIRVLVG
jgi:chaperonin GroEL